MAGYQFLHIEKHTQFASPLNDHIAGETRHETSEARSDPSSGEPLAPVLDVSSFLPSAPRGH